MAALPLHEGDRAEAEAWKDARPMACTCGRSLPRFARRCPVCRARNPLPRLRSQRRGLERLLERRLQAEALPALRQADLLPEALAVFARMLAEVARRPVAERQPAEGLPAYLRRLTTFFPAMFKTTSPELLSRDLDDRFSRTALAMTRQALKQVDQALEHLVGQPAPRLPEDAVQAQAARVQQDLRRAFTPLAGRLLDLQTYHDRLVQAWAPVRPLFLREPQSGALKATWDKVRELVHPVGRLFRFGQAIWRSDEERAALARLEGELLCFLERAERFRAGEGDYGAGRDAQLLLYCRALRGHVVACLLEHLAAAPAGERAARVERVLFAPGVGGFWFRLFHRKPAAGPRMG